jgi:hypothetical protein
MESADHVTRNTSLRRGRTSVTNLTIWNAPSQSASIESFSPTICSALLLIVSFLFLHSIIHPTKVDLKSSKDTFGNGKQPPLTAGSGKKAGDMNNIISDTDNLGIRDRFATGLGKENAIVELLKQLFNGRRQGPCCRHAMHIIVKAVTEIFPYQSAFRCWRS